MSESIHLYTTPAAEEILQRAVIKLQERNIQAVVVESGEDARKLVRERIPAGAEVHTGKSKTLQDAGIFDMLQKADQFDFLRTRYMKMDRQTQAREIRKLISAPNFMLGSVNAITEDGVLVDTSATGSQVGPLAGSAGKVIPVVGSQKIVPDLETALRRIREYVLPWEDAQVRQRLPSGSFVGKILIIEQEWVAGRVEVILVRKPIGI